jgi:activating signal cointegrator 1
MKALTLRQPWARAIAEGAKRIETRSWRTEYRGPLLIHASAKFGPMERMAEMLFMQMGWLEVSTRLDLGGIVARCDLIECVPVEKVRTRLSKRERELGDYSDGRFAWLLSNPRPHRFIACKGKLGLWEYVHG